MPQIDCSVGGRCTDGAQQMPWNSVECMCVHVTRCGALSAPSGCHLNTSGRDWLPVLSSHVVVMGSILQTQL